MNDSEVPGDDASDAELSKVKPDSNPGIGNSDSNASLQLAEAERSQPGMAAALTVALFAFVLALSPIDWTTTLVHIKTGEYLANNGWLPPEHDIFSQTATKSIWINGAWLFDLLVYGLYQIGGFAVLTISKALVVGISFFLLMRLCRQKRNVTWSVVLGLLLVLASLPRMNVLPDIITLLGVTLILVFWNQWRLRGSAAAWWKMVPVYLFWINMDPRAFLGVGLLLILLVGELLQSFLFDHQREGPTLGKVGIAGLFCITAVFVNPFGYRALFQSQILYVREYPLSRQYLGFEQMPEAFSLATRLSEQLQDITVLAGIGLFFVALWLLIARWRGATISLFLMLFAGLLASLAARYELAIASLLWFAISLIQMEAHLSVTSLSDSFRELRMARLSRLLAGVMMVTILVLAITGRLDRQFGIGLSPALQTRLDGFEDAFETTVNNRPFHTSISDGDVLVWFDQKSFVDSRLPLFSRDPHGLVKEEPISPELIDIFRDTVAALRNPQPWNVTAARSAGWRETFDQFRISHVVLGLSESKADYRVFNQLASSPMWNVTGLYPTCVVICRNDFDFREQPLQNAKSQFEQRRADVQKAIDMRLAEMADVIKQAYDPEQEPEELDRNWPEPEFSFLQFGESEQPPALKTRMASNRAQYLRVTNDGRIPMSFSYATGLAYLVIRDANRALKENPRDAEAYLALASAYGYLWIHEKNASQNTLGQIHHHWRLAQIMSALSLAAEVDPDSEETLLRHIRFCLQNRRRDVAMTSINSLLDLLRQRDEDEEVKKQIENLQKVFADLQKAQETEIKGVNNLQERGANLADAVSILQRDGFPLTALELLSGAESSELHQMAAPGLLITTGQPSEADKQLRLRQEAAEGNLTYDWYFHAGLVATLRADCETAARHWLKSLVVMRKVSGGKTPRLKDETLFVTGVSYLESGHVQKAKEIFERILRENPETQIRPILFLYLLSMGEKDIKPYPPSMRTLFRPMPSPPPPPMPFNPPKPQAESKAPVVRERNQKPLPSGEGVRDGMQDKPDIPDKSAPSNKKR